MRGAHKLAAIDEYLKKLRAEQRNLLQDLRAQIHSMIPDAEECISYKMPAFRVNGEVVAGFRATARGCSYYPFSGKTLGTLSSDLGAYSQTKSALHFSSNQPLPISLVRKLIKARVAEIRTKSG